MGTDSLFCLIFYFKTPNMTTKRVRTVWIKGQDVPQITCINLGI